MLCAILISKKMNKKLKAGMDQRVRAGSNTKSFTTKSGAVFRSLMDHN